MSVTDAQFERVYQLTNRLLRLADVTEAEGFYEEAQTLRAIARRPFELLKVRFTEERSCPEST